MSKLFLSYLMFLRKIVFSTFHIPTEFSCTRFSKTKYFAINKKIGELGAGEGWRYEEASKLADK